MILSSSFVRPEFMRETLSILYPKYIKTCIFDTKIVSVSRMNSGPCNRFSRRRRCCIFRAISPKACCSN